MLISLLFLYLFIHVNLLQKRKYADQILSFIGTSIVWTLFLYGATEILSVIHLLEKVPLACVWYGISIILFLLLITGKRRLATWDYIRSSAKKLKNIKPIHVTVIFFAVFMIFLAFTTVPYNYDSMTYHLPRICHWTQNQSVAHYASNVVRQVTSPVLHEFINLHVYILFNKKDNALNLLQCFSYLVNAGLVYSIAKKLQCKRKLCLVAGLLYWSMPIAFAEALTTQNDNFATVWLLYFTYILIGFTDRKRGLKFDKNTVLKVCMLGLLVGLGYLTKPSICVGMLVLVSWLFLICIVRRDSVSVLVKLSGIAIPSIILPVIPETIRNITTFSAISAPIAGQRQLIGTINPLYVFINFLKNFLFNLPNVYIYGSNDLLTGVVEKAAAILQVNLNDPSISEDGRVFMMHAPPAYSHDVAINPVITGLMLIFVIYAILNIKKKKINDIFLNYSFVSVVCFASFCVILRWEPYVTRYMSAYLALLCPMIVLQIQKIANEKIKYALWGIICFVCIAEIVSMGIFHWQYVSVGKEDRNTGYFVRHVDEYEIYRNFCQTIEEEGFRSIGLKIREEDFEYPLWRMLEDVDRIEHVKVENATGLCPKEELVPDCIIWIGELSELVIEQGGKEYHVQESVGERYFLLY